MLSESTGFNSAVQFITVLVIFLLILGMTYFVSRFTAQFQKGKMTGRNIRVIEVFRVANDRFILIVEIAGKHLALAMTKDQITLLTELDADSIVEPDTAFSKNLSFEELFKKAKEKKRSDEK